MNWSRKPAIVGIGAEEWTAGHDELHPAGAHCHEVSVADWPVFCRWFTIAFRGFELSAQCHEGTAITNEAINLPLESIEMHILENGVSAITVLVRAGSRLRRLNITAARHVRMYCNAAGWPTELEIVTGGGSMSLKFSDGIEPRAESASTCWGE